MGIKDKIYFVSDVHLGSSVFNDSREREKRLVRWMDSIREEAKALYLLGDIFDFWFEYKAVAPQGFTRFLGKLAELSDSGVEIHYFIGNHDIWIYDYLPEEIGLTLHKSPFVTKLADKTFYLAHGDGLGDYSRSFQLIRGIFHNQFCQILFRAIHPDLGVKIGNTWAKHSRLKEQKYPKPFLGEEKEDLIIYSKSYIQTHPEIDYLIFGHRHILLDKMLNSKSRIMIIGDWLQLFTYAVFDGKELTLNHFEE
ncbi:MAG: UDP-2,3-diacylglucosamine diphosphatase [Candidatus Azobacteroides sp.]|nr:UDP-2,3-diacylglucosamine diphosphatase [Candidatus Azobacteroides sp.]